MMKVPNCSCGISSALLAARNFPSNPMPMAAVRRPAAIISKPVTMIHFLPALSDTIPERNCDRPCTYSARRQQKKLNDHIMQDKPFPRTSNMETLN